MNHSTQIIQNNKFKQFSTKQIQAEVMSVLNKLFAQKLGDKRPRNYIKKTHPSSFFKFHPEKNQFIDRL